MARLRHLAVVVKDLERAAGFYQSVFGLEQVGREDLDIGSGIYLSDGTINLVHYAAWLVKETARGD